MYVGTYHKELSEKDYVLYVRYSFLTWVGTYFNCQNFNNLALASMMWKQSPHVRIIRHGIIVVRED